MTEAMVTLYNKTTEERKLIKEWCRSNLGPQAEFLLPISAERRWYFNYQNASGPGYNLTVVTMYFHSEEDAILFKLTWM